MEKYDTLSEGRLLALLVLRDLVIRMLAAFAVAEGAARLRHVHHFESERELNKRG